MARALVEHGADVTIRNEKRRTALHEAAYRGHLELSHFLLSSGIDVHAEDRDFRCVCFG